jgi:dihydrolipoamide dehydrogenase
LLIYRKNVIFYDDTIVIKILKYGSVSKKMSYDFDVVVIGSGPGGYVAGIRAARLGLKVAVVERGALGGVCLNIGCIPSKAIIRQAEAFRGRSKLVAMGVAVDDTGFRYEKVFDASRKAAETLSRGVAYLLKKNGVAVVAGSARLASDHEVVVDGDRRISAGAIIVATGSRPKPLPGLDFDGERVLSSDDALMMKMLPKRALIAGAGAIGVEFAHILSSFGSEVRLVEVAGHILPTEDGEVTGLLARSFAKRGVKVYTSSRVKSYKINVDSVNKSYKNNGGSTDISYKNDVDSADILLQSHGNIGDKSYLSNGDSINAVIEAIGEGGGEAAVSVDRIFVMAGRTPNTEGIGLEELGIGVSGRFVKVNANYQTSVPSVYAIGDIVGTTPLLAHVASREGEIAAEHIAGAEHISSFDKAKIPAVVYCEPQVASFGLTEERAAAAGIDFSKASFPFKGCGKAVAVGDSEGFVKILVDKSTNAIIGAHIIGPEASELIHELLLAAHNPNAGLESIAGMIHAHPTLSEAVMEAAHLYYGTAVHI